jgi:class 3 adenylate cyclase
MSHLVSLSQQTQINALVAFADLTYYTKTASKMENQEVASWMNTFFERLGEIIELKGGVIVKFIGDAALIVFEEKLAEQGIHCLLEAKEQIDGWLQKEGYKSRLEIKIHFGPVIAGPFGSKSKKTFDVIGNTVNTAATLQERPFCLSTQAFRQLSPEGRKHFKKHTPPITYIREEDRHS